MTPWLLGTALAQGGDPPEIKAMQRKAIEEDYLATDFKSAQSRLKEAIGLCKNGGCSPQFVAELHRDLAVVLIAGLKKKAAGEKEMAAAVKVDPEVQLDPATTTQEVKAAYEKAGGIEQAQPEPPASDLEEFPDEEDEDDLESDVPDAEENPTKARLNWVSLSYQQDFMFHSRSEFACNSGNYFCFDGAGTYYPPPGQDDPIVLDFVRGDDLSGGLAPATGRILIGYDRVFLDNFTVGARLGFAFGSTAPAVEGASAFSPLHLELRVAYWIGSKPFENDSIKPFVALSGGRAEVQSKVLIEQFLTPEAGGDPNEPPFQVNAYKKGLGNFVAGSLGALIPVYGPAGLLLELKVGQTFPTSATFLSGNLGVAVGF